jgi:hypothetical protein
MDKLTQKHIDLLNKEYQESFELDVPSRRPDLALQQEFGIEAEEAREMSFEWMKKHRAA